MIVYAGIPDLVQMVQTLIQTDANTPQAGANTGNQASFSVKARGSYTS